MTGYTETIARFGPGGGMVGILASPATREGDVAMPETLRPNVPTVVIVNTGVVHRIGNHRMNVIFARALASAGFAVLRFDFAGLGDSAARPLQANDAEHGDADLRDALDWLEAQGLSNFALMGLCSGADRSVVHAGTDRRVRRLILLDPTLTPTARFLRNRLRSQIVRITHTNPLPNLLRRLRGRTAAMRAPQDVTEQRRAGPLAFLKRRHIRGYLEAAYAKAIGNDVRMLALFTSSVQIRHNYREQMLDAFHDVAFGDRLDLHYLDGVTHLLLHERERARGLAIITAWLGEPAAPVAQATRRESLIA